MSALQQLSDSWRYGLLGGLVALPFTALSYAQTGDNVALGAVFWAALLVGYLAKRRGLPSTPVGVRAGLVGGLPALLLLSEPVVYILGLGGPSWFRAIQLGLVALFLPLVFGLAAVVGGFGGRLGGWLAEHRGHPDRPVTGA